MKREKTQRRPTVSAVLATGDLVELVYDRQERRSSLVVGRENGWTIVQSQRAGIEDELVPYSAKNRVMATDVVLLPSKPEEYGTEEELAAEIRSFIRKYVELDRSFEEIATHYVLLSWVHDRFTELPYLRVRGDFGSGKTRFLLTVGSLCYRPIFASGASTISPIFHLVDAFRGTLIVDEADFRTSDEKSDIVKLLNNGNVRGVRILRMEVNQQGEYNPRAFDAFGPKLVATRGFYDDRALESRFITGQMGARPLRSEVPINLGGSYREEALSLRNKLLQYRLRNYHRIDPAREDLDPALEPRTRQIFAPLLAVARDTSARTEVERTAREHHEELMVDRGMGIEAEVLDVLTELFRQTESSYVPVRDVAKQLSERYGSDIGRHVSNRWVGSVIRKKLHLRTQKRNGIFVVPFTEKAKTVALAARYGLESERRDSTKSFLADDANAGDAKRNGADPS